ncbi:MAG: TRAP-type C4-dicarboxylate transport system permease small subunit [Chitinophagales bacterium]
MNYLVVLFHKLENALLYSVVIGLVSISLSQIWLRNVHDSGIYWGDSALRVLVFWLAMVGAMVASRETGHISIDALSRYLSPLWRKITATSTSVFSASVCFIAAWHSYLFVKDEREFGDIAFANIPVWWCEAIMPVALFVIGLRFLIQLFFPIPQAPEQDT